MRYSPRGAFRDQVNVLRRQFLQDGGLPFTDVLTEAVIADALAAVGRWLDRVFTPVVTLWVFLGQALAADQSCRAAVARLIAHRVARGLPAVQFRDGGVLSGEEASARAVRLRRGPPRGAEPGRAGRSAVALEGPSRLPVRRHDGRHARHTGEPRGRIPWPTTRCPGPTSPSRGSGRSSRCRAGRSSTWASAATLARVRGRSACSGSCGTCCTPATCCWGTA